jgi:peptidoglycan biosynthesis protein MviN/MurJ (putative lipid II flippase)
MVQLLVQAAAVDGNVDYRNFVTEWVFVNLPFEVKLLASRPESAQSVGISQLYLILIAVANTLMVWSGSVADEKHLALIGALARVVEDLLLSLIDHRRHDVHQLVNLLSYVVRVRSLVCVIIIAVVISRHHHRWIGKRLLLNGRTQCTHDCYCD